MSSRGDSRVRAAIYLLDCGLPHSARELLSIAKAHGHAASRARRSADRRCRGSRIGAAPGIYALAAEGAAGAAVPLQAERRPNPESVEKRALELARALFDRGGLPSLRLLIPECLQLIGRSLGLPAMLTFVGRYAGIVLDRPIFATGELAADGAVLPVGHVEQKVRVALAELGARDGLILVPPGTANSFAGATKLVEVASAEEATARVFGDKLTITPTILSFSKLVADVHATAHDPTRALELLEAYPADELGQADRVHYQFLLGSFCRHAGRGERALRIHRTAHRSLDGVRNALRPALAEELELELWATDIDQFSFEELEPVLRARLQSRFLWGHNRIRCRGMLAQVLSSRGSYDEAIALRRQNLGEQIASGTERLLQEVPRTLAVLGLDQARAGDARGFDATITQLLADRYADDGAQPRYTARAAGAGLVLLGRQAELLRWVAGERLWGVHVPDPLARILCSTAAISDHPEVSTARALARALRREDRPTEAVSLTERIVPDEERPLVAWLAHIARIEGALALGDLGKRTEAQARLSHIAQQLTDLYPAAALYHRALVELLGAGGSAEAIERELDRIFH